LSSNGLIESHVDTVVVPNQTVIKVQGCTFALRRLSIHVVKPKPIAVHGEGHGKVGAAKEKFERQGEFRVTSSGDIRKPSQIVVWLGSSRVVIGNKVTPSVGAHKVGGGCANVDGLTVLRRCIQKV